MTVALANAFSIGMLPPGRRHAVQFTMVPPEEVANVWAHIRNAHKAVAEALGRMTGGVVKAEPKVLCAIRHSATEAIALSMLGLSRDQVEQANSITLDKGVTLLVFLPRWKGGRPPETRDYTAEELASLTEGVDVWMCSLI
jgi:hypothetical protein